MAVIVILALVALFIGLRLYSVLGERTGHEQQPILNAGVNGTLAVDEPAGKTDVFERKRDFTLDLIANEIKRENALRIGLCADVCVNLLRRYDKGLGWLVGDE